jgi:hypothetical protein
MDFRRARDAHPELVWQISQVPRMLDDSINGDSSGCLAYQDAVNKMLHLSAEWKVRWPAVVCLGDILYNSAYVAGLLRIIKRIRPAQHDVQVDSTRPHISCLAIIRLIAQHFLQTTELSAH